MRRALVLLLALLSVLSASADAHAKRRREKKKRPNMPMGWVWPPDKEMKQEGKACLAHLDELGIVYKKGARKRKVANPIYVPAMEFGGVKFISTFRKPPFLMDCHLAAAMADHAEKLYDLGIREMHFSSIYDYRKVRIRGGKKKKPLSRHALGLAMDVYVFVTADGVSHVVENDYKHADELLLTTENTVNQTGAFRMLLTPGNDPVSHRDHFHFEARTPCERVETPAAVVSAPAGPGELAR